MQLIGTSRIVEPQPRRWTRDEYYRLAEQGMFAGQRVMLLEGEIVEAPPQGTAHYTALDRTAETLRAAFGKGYWVRTQAPLDLGQSSDAEPDVAVVHGAREDYLRQHPTTAVLVVEVSDSTLSFDRRRKASLYASAGIADYWIVNLVDGQLEVRRSPIADPKQEHGFRYADHVIVRPPDGMSPLALPKAQVRVADLLPS